MMSQQVCGQIPPVATVAAASSKPTLWEFLGVNQLQAAAGGCGRKLKTMPLFDNLHQALDPMLSLAGLKPGTAPNAFGPPGAGTPAGADGAPAPPPSAAEVSAKLAAEQTPANVALKVKALRFLGQQDCICYPEVVGAILAALDDCAEVVRFEALKALDPGCIGGACSFCAQNAYQPPGSVGCACCQCQEIVVKRLTDLLLDRDINGGPKEKSSRVRQLAAQIIRFCLQSRPVGEPDREGPRRQAEPDPPLPAPSN